MRYFRLRNSNFSLNMPRNWSQIESIIYYTEEEVVLRIRSKLWQSVSNLKTKQTGITEKHTYILEYIEHDLEINGFVVGKELKNKSNKNITTSKSSILKSLQKREPKRIKTETFSSLWQVFEKMIRKLQQFQQLFLSVYIFWASFFILSYIHLSISPFLYKYLTLLECLLLLTCSYH